MRAAVFIACRRPLANSHAIATDLTRRGPDEVRYSRPQFRKAEREAREAPW